MKRNYLKAIAVVCMVMGSLGAWAQTTITYDFTDCGTKTLEYVGTSSFRANSVDHFLPTNLPEAGDRFAFQHAGTVSVSPSDGLYVQRPNGDHVGILELSAGDKVTINFTAGAIMVRGAVPTYTGITSDWTTYTTGTEITMSAAGNLMFQAKTYCKISSIVIVTSATETVTAPTISSEGAAGGRSVTITSGASSIKSGVTTYYTTDGTTPTAASNKYTEPFLVTETSTVKAITISNSSAATTSTVEQEEINLDAVDVPTAAITKVDGITRTISFACTTDGATLSYSTDDGATYTEGTSVVISENTAIKVKATKNAASAESDVYNFEAGTLVALNAPTCQPTLVAVGFYKEYQISIDNSDVLLQPVATLSYVFTPINGVAEDEVELEGNVIECQGGTYVITAKADGYESRSLTIENLTAYENTVTYDFSDAQWTSTYTSGMTTGWPGGNLQYANAGAFNADYASANAYDIPYTDNPFGFIQFQADPALVEGLGLVNVNTGGRWFSIPSASTESYAVCYFKWNGVAGEDFRKIVTGTQLATTATVYTDRYACLQRIAILEPVSGKVLTSKASLGGYKTFYSEASNYEVDDNTTIYIAKEKDNKVTLSPVETNIVPQGVAVILKTSNTDTYEMTLTPTTEDADFDVFVENDLWYNHEEEENDDEYPAYVLGTGSQGLGFYKPGTLLAGDICITITGASGAPIRFVVEDEATAIKGVNVAKKNAAIYNVAGQKVNESYKGLVIKNGKKYLQK